MSREIKAVTYVGELFISKHDYNRLLSWGQSENEINAICFGNGKIIENVTRLRNISHFPKNYCLDSESERKALIKEKKKSGQIILAGAHSHPSKHHNHYPSVIDVKYIKKGSIELIVFPHRNSIRAWRIASSVKATLLSEIELVIIPD